MRVELILEQIKKWGEDLGGEQEITSIVMEQDYTMAPTCPPVTGRRGRGTKRSRLPSTVRAKSLLRDTITQT